VRQNRKPPGLTAAELAELDAILEVERRERVRRDPLFFVQDSFPWGAPGALAHEAGPDVWQADILAAVRDGLLTMGDAIRVAVASGHGVGKSAIAAWLILWALTTAEDTRGVVTANTESQLRTKTWAELAKWFGMLRGRERFQLAATAIYSRERERTWRIDMVPWSERNTEAFAGLHNAGKRLLLIFDEASAIPDIIWQTAEGALTDADTEILWFVFGNPTRNTGRFRECFDRFAHRWLIRHVDSRTAKKTNKAQIDQWVADYGEDSDFVRVRVRGTFPLASSTQFISSELVTDAIAREVPPPDYYDACIMGVDVARFGTDETVIRIRRGRDARSIPPICLRGADTMQVAARVTQEAKLHAVDMIFVDGGGVGAGVVDRLHELRQTVREVQFGGRSDASLPGRDSGIAYANKRAEMWGALRDWLPRGFIDNSPQLIADLTSVEYGYTFRDGREAIILEKKEDMRRRGLASPDNGDALALTFAYPVQKSDHRARLFRDPQVLPPYDPFAEAFNSRYGAGWRQ